MAYNAVFTIQFEKDVKSIKKDNLLLQRLEQKIVEILNEPEHYKPLRNVLKGKRRAHVGSFVIIFEVIKEEVILYRFEHHDKVYK